ncbi:MAG TPA: hypothetical protein VGM23_06000, partial [Armatimonadota bacterium]
EYLLYLFDQHNPPRLGFYRGASFLTLEPLWPMRPVRVGDAVSLNLALSAGEIAGASSDGVWVACRAPRPAGGVCCGIIARLKAAVPTAAKLTVGNDSREVPLSTRWLPGIGEVATAVVEFPDGQLTDPLSGIVAGIADRRLP